MSEKAKHMLVERHLRHDLELASVSRRDALRIGLFSTAGLAVCQMVTCAVPPPHLPGSRLRRRPVKAKAKSVIQIFLWGGMSHNDTWDPKPASGYDYMGEFPKAIPTNVDGIQIGELFPNLAKQADKYLAHPQHDASEQWS